MKQGWITNLDCHKHYVNDIIHNDTGPAIIWEDGSKAWFKHGVMHRLDGPAFDGNACKEWQLNGLTHREDGPAIEYPNGDQAWWYNDLCIGQSKDGYTNEEFLRWVRLQIFS